MVRADMEAALDYMVEARHGDFRHQGRHGVRRRLHEQRIEDMRAAAAVTNAAHGCTDRTRLWYRRRRGGGRRARQDLHRCRYGMARAGMLDVRRHEWRHAGAGRTIGMTSNRNLEGVETAPHLVSPAMAAAASVTGHFTDVRKLMKDHSHGTFKTFASVAVPIDIANPIRTIIPARFLRRGRMIRSIHGFYSRLALQRRRFRKGFRVQHAAVQGWPHFCRGRKLGCGSSRENAVTALGANGVRSVIAPSIADIHYNNCIKNGVLPIRLPEEVCSKLREQLRESPGAEIAIDLDSQSVTGPDQTTYSFEINAFDKHRLLNGLDDVGLTIELDDKIEAFKAGYQKKYSWASSS